MNTSEKVAYVKGLAEGLGYDNKSKEGKILTAILDILAARNIFLDEAMVQSASRLRAAKRHKR